MKNPHLVAFGQTIRKIRKEKGLSQEAFADLAGLDRSYMGCIERGEKNVTLTKIFQLTDALKTTPVEVFGQLNLQVDTEL